MIRLVINADDLGLHPRIDEGIFRARVEGVVTSASLLATGPTAPEAVRRANREKLALGLHLCLTTHLSPAAPARDVRWLAPGGRFRKNWVELSAAWLARLVPAEEVVLELRAQVRRARELGAQIDHLDTHQHLHLLPGMTSIVEVLAAELGVPMRWPVSRPSPRWLVYPRSALKAAVLTGLAGFKQERGVTRVRAHGVFESGRLNEKRLLRLVDGLNDGDHEIVTHPGMDPGVVPQEPGWRYGWEQELTAVTSARVRQSLRDRGVTLCTYAELT
ncbi:MAG: ChbG/HpnK family deacetylase [Myxococcales bacterium]|nr:ChbG/HpnK family deacetylase [Myxococcales bacterium]